MPTLCLSEEIGDHKRTSIGGFQVRWAYPTRAGMGGGPHIWQHANQWCQDRHVPHTPALETIKPSRWSQCEKFNRLRPGSEMGILFDIAMFLFLHLDQMKPTRNNYRVHFPEPLSSSSPNPWFATSLRLCRQLSFGRQIRRSCPGAVGRADPNPRGPILAGPIGAAVSRRRAEEKKWKYEAERMKRSKKEKRKKEKRKGETDDDTTDLLRGLAQHAIAFSFRLPRAPGCPVAGRFVTVTCSPVSPAHPPSFFHKYLPSHRFMR